MEIAIIGISGLSKVTQLLNQCGLKLVPENQEIVDLHDEILQELGGDISPGWSSSFKLYQERIKGILTSFDQTSPWCWQDPRGCFTLELWLNMFPEMKGVVYVRHPHEADQALWHKYYEALADYEDRLIFTHQDAYVYDAPAELKRLTDALGMEVSDKIITHALTTIDIQHQLTPDFLAQSETYQRLCSLSGTVYQRLLADYQFRFEQLSAFTAKIYTNQSVLHEAQEKLKKQDRDIVWFQAQIEQARKDVQAAQDELRKRNGDLKTLRKAQQEIRKKQATINDLYYQLDAYRAHMERTLEYIDEIEQ